MNRVIALVPLVLGLMLLGRASPAAEPGRGPATVSREQAAQTTAEQWLALVDAGKYAESWDTMSADFKKTVSKRKWNSTVSEIRNPLGKVLARKLKSAEYTKDLPGAPEGEFVVLKFETSFEHRPTAIETVTPILESDLLWRVSVYSVK